MNMKLIIFLKSEEKTHLKKDTEMCDNLKNFVIVYIFFNWYSLHARLSSHYEAWSYKKRKHKKVKTYRKSI